MPSLSTGQQIKALIDSGKFEAARKLVRENPSSKSAAMMARIDLEESLARSTSIEGEMATIKKAIAEKRYDDAEALLLLSDHPDADKYLQRLATARANITNLEGGQRAAAPVTVSSPKIKNNDISPEESIAGLIWFLCALAALVAGVLKLFN